MKFYILSLKHTLPGDKYIAFWGPDNCGYATDTHSAGLYENPSVGYHDDYGNMPVSQTDVSRICVNVKGQNKMVLPNTAKVWAALGVKKTNKGLTRLITAL